MSVSKDASVVALERVVQDAMAHALKDGLLAGEVRVVRVDGVEAVVESERLWWFSAEIKRHFNIIILIQNMYNDHPRDPKIAAVIDRWSLFRGYLCNRNSKREPKTKRWSLFGGGR